MNDFDATKPTINTFNSSPFAPSMPICDENDVANTPLPRRMSGFAKSVGPLCDAAQRHDGKMTPPAVMLDDQLDHGARFPSNERARLRARRSATALALTVCPVGAASLDRARGESMLLAKKVAVL
jgi:hypothetical protein